jgi:hypothetical protein
LLHFRGSCGSVHAPDKHLAFVYIIHLQVQQQTGSRHQAQQASSPQQASTSSSGSFLSRWRWSAPNAPADSSPSAVTADATSSPEASSSSHVNAGCSRSSNGSASSSEASPTVAAAATAFELVEAQAPLTKSMMQEPFVLVSQLLWSMFVWGYRSAGLVL